MSDWHIDTALSNISIGYFDTELKPIAEAIAPIVDVGKQSDAYYRWTKGDFFRIPDTKRSPKTNPKRVEFTVTTQNYNALNYALGAEIPFEQLGNADEALELETSFTKGIVQLLGIDWENRVASLVTCGTNAGSYVQLSASAVPYRWSDKANSDPVSDVRTAQNFILQNTGQKPNCMIVGYNVHQALVDHPDFIDRIKYTTQALRVNVEAAIAGIFGVEKYVVGDKVKNTGTEGLSNNFGFVWGNNVVLAHVAKAPGRGVPSFMYSFRWVPGKFPAPFEARKRDDDSRYIREIEVQYFQDERIVSSDLGYVINSAV